MSRKKTKPRWAIVTLNNGKIDDVKGFVERRDAEKQLLKIKDCNICLVPMETNGNLCFPPGTRLLY